MTKCHYRRCLFWSSLFESDVHSWLLVTSGLIYFKDLISLVALTTWCMKVGLLRLNAICFCRVDMEDAPGDERWRGFFLENRLNILNWKCVPIVFNKSKLYNVFFFFFFSFPPKQCLRYPKSKVFSAQKKMVIDSHPHTPRETDSVFALFKMFPKED